MDGHEIQLEVMKLMEKKLGFPEQIQGLTLAMLEIDEDRFEKILSSNILHIGFERTMINLIYPFFQKIGVLWQTGSISPAQEHFISNLVRQKVIVAIDGQVVCTSNCNKKYLLYLPENEMHEISLLFSAYLIKARNNRVIYLGQNVPQNDLMSIYKDHNPDYLLTVMTTHPVARDIQAYVYKLSESFKNAKIIVTGHQVIEHDIDIPKNVMLFNKLQDLVDHLDYN
jgi:methanogenic corrinoid protein MtbC1